MRRRLPPRTYGQLVTANSEAGLYFFTPGAKRFFNATVCRTVYAGSDGWYFVEGTRFDLEDPDYPTRWTVRKATPDGKVHTVGRYQEHSCKANALVAAAMAAEHSVFDEQEVAT